MDDQIRRSTVGTVRELNSDYTTNVPEDSETDVKTFRFLREK